MTHHNWADGRLAARIPDRPPPDTCCRSACFLLNPFKVVKKCFYLASVGGVQAHRCAAPTTDQLSVTVWARLLEFDFLITAFIRLLTICSKLTGNTSFPVSWRTFLKRTKNIVYVMKWKLWWKWVKCSFKVLICDLCVQQKSQCVPAAWNQNKLSHVAVGAATDHSQHRTAAS